MAIPKNRADFQRELLHAFRAGIASGYAVDHDHFVESENEQVIEYAEKHSIPESVYKDFLFTGSENNE